MHPLTMDFSEQILALIRVHSYSLLGAIQDNKTVLGGSGGSGGGVGDPPAGFVGQLTQSNVTFDTGGSTRACSAGSSGSSSLVDNLDAIRLGNEICNDAIRDRHIDWGHGAEQVDAEDVPFTSGSLVSTNVHDALEELLGQGGIKTIGQVVSVGVSGCNYTLVSDAVAYINGLGDAAADKPYLIWMMAGEFVEAADVTIPQHVDLVGQGEATILDMTDATLVMSADTSLRNLVVTSTADDNWYVLYLATADNAVVDDVRVIVTGSSGTQECIDVYRSNNFELIHVICESTQPTNYGFVIYKSIGLLWDCKASDTTNFDIGLLLHTAANPGTTTTKFCEFRAASGGNDVWIAANNVWNHFACQFDPDNINMLGTEVPLPHGRTYLYDVTRIGDPGGGNYSEFEADGTLKFIGTATVWNDLPTTFDSARVPAANAPTWASFQGNLNAYTFADGDLLEITTEVLHGYKEDSDIEIHVHWVTSGSNVDNRAVKWEVEYTLANPDTSDGVGDAFPVTTIDSAETTIPANTPDLTHMYTAVETITGTGIKIDAIIKARVRRITAAGTAPTDDPFGLNLGIHYEVDTVGSRTLAAK